MEKRKDGGILRENQGGNKRIPLVFSSDNYQCQRADTLKRGFINIPSLCFNTHTHIPVYRICVCVCVFYFLPYSILHSIVFIFFFWEILLTRLAGNFFSPGQQHQQVYVRSIHSLTPGLNFYFPPPLFFPLFSFYDISSLFFFYLIPFPSYILRVH